MAGDSGEPEDRGRPDWDAGFAETLLGTRVLIGLTYCDDAGAETRREQLHGVVVEATREQGVQVKLEGVNDGAVRALPPSTSVFEAADPGVYTLRTTGEEVVDPDFLATWTITEKA